MMVAVPAKAQETTGVPGSPSATTTIDGKQIPPPNPKFGGEILAVKLIQVLHVLALRR
jgi:hypothetical protein